MFINLLFFSVVCEGYDFLKIVELFWFLYRLRKLVLFLFIIVKNWFDEVVDIFVVVFVYFIVLIFVVVFKINWILELIVFFVFFFIFGFWILLIFIVVFLLFWRILFSCEIDFLKLLVNFKKLVILLF